MPQPTSLRLARLYWAAGEPLPLDVEVSLMALGYDVPSLQRRYGA